MKNFNFKKVLALVLSLAMVLSVCLTGFAVSAETAEVDLSYCIVNDTAMKSWRADHENMALANYDGKTVYRIAPQKAKAGLLPFSSKVELTAEQAASVNTVAYYVANEIGSDLELGFQYYGSNGTYNAFLGAGYIYFLDADNGDILPIKSNNGYYRIPAGVKGYIIYDISNADNYGVGDWEDAEGNPVKSVDAFKDNCFKPLMLRANYTEDMIGKAWYVGDLTVSTKTVEDFAKYVSGADVISYNFNTASVRSYELDEAMNYWNGNGKFDTTSNGHAEIVDFDGLEGKGSKFTIAKVAANDGKVAIRNDFVQTRGSGLPFAIEKAKGIRIELKKTGDVGFFLAFNSNKDTFAGTYYLVSDSGVVSTAATVPANFCGTAYLVFDEKAVMVGKSADNAVTWEEYINSKTGDYNLSTYSGAGGAVGDSITFGSFSFIYDTTAIDEIMNPKNPVFIDGTRDYTGWFRPKNGYTTTATQYSRMTSERINDKFVFTMAPKGLTAVEQNSDYLYFTSGNATKDGNYTVANPENVNGISFEIKVEGLPDGAFKAITPHLVGSNKPGFLGSMKAISYDGTVVATYETTAVRVDDDPETAGGTLESKNQKSSLMVPNGFEGIIIMEFDNDALVVDSYGASAGDKVYSFEEYITSVNSGVIKSMSDIGGFYTSTGGALYTNNLPDVKVTYDTFRLIYDDIDTYVADYSSDINISKRAAAKAEADKAAALAEREEMLTGTHIISNLSGANGNTSSTGTNYKSAIEYVANDSEDGYAARMTFALANYEKEDGTTADSNPQVYNVVNTAGLDLRNVVAFTYRANIVTPNNKPFYITYQLNAQQNGLRATGIYLVSDSGEITKYNSSTGFNQNFTGTVVVMIDRDLAVNATWGSTAGEHSWTEFLELYSSKTSVIDRFNFWVTYSGAVADYEGTYFDFDDIAVVYGDNPIIKTINDQLDTDKYFANYAAPNSKAFGQYSSLVADYAGKYGTGGVYTASMTTTSNGAPAFKFTDNGVEHRTDGAYEFNIANASTLTADEINAKEALVYYVKIEGGNVPLSANFGSAYPVKTSYIAYDINTKESMLLTGSKTLGDGFEGYIIIPLKNAIVGKDGAEMSFADYINNVGFKGLYYYMWGTSVKATEFVFGGHQFVDSLSVFMAEIGAETTPGDANNDTVVDVRDMVRLKKFNADAKTLLAYHNADIDNNGFIDTAAELIASRKQNLGVKFEAPELDYSLAKYPDVMVGFYHGDYGVWDYYASDVAAESNVLNAYTSLDMYALSQMKQNGGTGWMYISKTFAGEPVFGTKDGGYDNAATEINEAWKTALDDAINEYKAQGVWNQVVGFHTEEVLMTASKYMSQSQYATMTKYLRDTYGKRVLAVLSVYEVVGNPDFEAGPIPAATPETYAYVTDIGFDKYGIDTDDEKTAFTNTFNAMKENTGNRADVKYWVLPTTYCGKTAEGTPARTDASIAEEIAWFDDFFANTDLIPESQRGGILFYTFRTFYDGGYDYPVSAGNFGSFGLDKLMSEYNYTLTAKAIADMAAKYVK
ncbi:MAG: hypothetical protein E7524_03045 [Ruminococcaceae bacterium]|nr:hypothetical protein [Oscillospiraceae bacterium]